MTFQQNLTKLTLSPEAVRTLYDLPEPAEPFTVFGRAVVAELSRVDQLNNFPHELYHHLERSVLDPEWRVFIVESAGNSTEFLITRKNPRS